MPYKSKAQQRYMHAAASRGEISEDTVKEFDQATKKGPGFKSLPERVGKKKMKKKAGLRSVLGLPGVYLS